MMNEVDRQRYGDVIQPYEGDTLLLGKECNAEQVHQSNATLLIVESFQHSSYISRQKVLFLILFRI